MTFVSFPLRFDAAGRTDLATLDRHVRDMIETLLFTAPGERVMRPDVGSGIEGLVFGAASPEVASALQFVIQANLERWLGDVLRIEALTVTAVEATLAVELSYTVLSSGETRTDRFARGAA